MIDFTFGHLNKYGPLANSIQENGVLDLSMMMSKIEQLINPSKESQEEFHDYVYLRNNPYGSQNLITSKQLDQSVNTVFANTINYLDLENGGIIKRSENYYDNSHNLQYFLTEVSS